ncbi:MAG: methyltransferase domain-containing protein [Bdellovibrionota bacterium]
MGALYLILTLGSIDENCLISAVYAGDLTRPAVGSDFHAVTGDDTSGDSGQWDSVYKTKNYVFGKEPASILKEKLKILPSGGRALDIAMGEGRNAVYLAANGFQVEGVDISEVAIHKAKRLAREFKVEISTIRADLTDYQINPGVYDLIVNINYLQRTLVPRIKAGLKKGGMVVFENQTTDQLKISKDANLSKDYLLAKGELKALFSDFEILLFRETNDGKEALATLIARKP